MRRILLAAIVFGALAPVVAHADERAARQHYERAERHFRAERYEEALAEFRASWDEAQVARTQYAIGRTQRLLRHYPEAIIAYEHYVTMVGERQADPSASAVQDEIDHLRHLVGRYELAITPDGATVSIDGHEVGTSPLGGAVWLSAGSHRLEVSRDGSRTYQRNLDVAPDAEETIEVSLVEASDMARLVVSAEPEVIGIEMDGLPIGETPEGRDVAAGTHHLRFFRPGYISQEQDIVLGPGQHRRLHIGLTEDVVWNHWLFWTLLGAAVIGAGVALAVAFWPQPEIGGNLHPPIVEALSW